MNKRTAFNTETRLMICFLMGAITKKVTDIDGVEDFKFLYPDNYVFFSGDYRIGWYLNVDLETLMEKQMISYSIDKPTLTADGVDTATVSGLPTLCTVYFKNPLTGVEESQTITDGEFEFVALAPGDYLFYIDEIEYQYTEIIIHAEA